MEGDARSSGLGLDSYNPAEDLYAMLGVRVDATDAEIRTAHRVLIRDRHPDRGGNTRHAATLNIARDVLLDPASRQRYDAMRARWQHGEMLHRAFLDAMAQLEAERRAHAESAHARPRPAQPARPAPPPPPGDWRQLLLPANDNYSCRSATG